MQSEEIRKRFLEFFQKRGHAIIPSASLVPENDPSVLFTTAGMQPLVPYLMGEKHPLGNRLVNVQKCVRTQDIEEVGDKTHDTFFEMLGNWSLGDPDAPDGVGTEGYFKKEAITWSYEFLTSKEEGLCLDPKRLYITCFAGDKDAPKDIESAEVWKSLGVPEKRIYFLGKDKNWWSPGDNGPCGPDTEMYYDVTPEGLGDLDLGGFKKADDEQKVIELWNDVFMEYEKKDGKVIGKLKQKNVDTGAGLERLVMVMQGKDNIFDTDLLRPLVAVAQTMSLNIRDWRIIADHFRTAVFMIADGVVPSNTERGYVLRKLIRKASSSVMGQKIKKTEIDTFVDIIEKVIYKNSDYHEDLKSKSAVVKEILWEEIQKYKKTIVAGEKLIPRELKKVDGLLTGYKVFDISSTLGVTRESILEEAKGLSLPISDKEEFEHREAFKKHQELSRKGAGQKFAGGLADHSEQTIKYHTATHMLHEALRRVLGTHVHQRGSNITQKRLRFDFAHPQKMTDEEKKKVEDLMNEKIAENLPVSFEETSPDEAFSKGALGEFGAKYGDRVKVYSVGEGTNRFSYEICGGPHVGRTGTMGTFKIIKEEAIAQGIRRIKAVLQ